MRKVTVKRFYQNEIDHDYPELGVFYDDQGVVIVCDRFGAVDVFSAKPVENTSVVLVDENPKSLIENNADFFINLILSGGAK